VVEALGARREAEDGLAGGLAPGDRPVEVLVVGQGVDVGARRQVLERLLVDSDDIGGLHPRDVLRAAAADLGEVPQLLADVAAFELLREVVDVLELVGQGREVSVEPPDHADPDLAGLDLSRDLRREVTDRHGVERHLGVLHV
jgi:hypothetical protein